MKRHGRILGKACVVALAAAAAWQTASARALDGHNLLAIALVCAAAIAAIRLKHVAEIEHRAAAVRGDIERLLPTPPEFYNQEADGE